MSNGNVDPEPRHPEPPRQFWPLPPPDRKPRRGLGHLARRIAGRTTDLLALAILLIGGLTIGRQVTIWWQDNPVRSLASADLQANLPLFDFPAGPGDPLRLEFGASPFSLERQVVAGEAGLALNSLFDRVRLTLESAPLPRDPPNAAERRLLKAIANLGPAVEQPGDWQIFQLEGVPTAVVGVRFQAPRREGAGNGGEETRGQGPGTKPGTAGQDSVSKSVAVEGGGSDEVETSAGKSVRQQPRVVCWGFLFPFSPTAWTTYLFSPTGATGLAGVELPQVDLPTGSWRTMALREAHGGTLIGFQGQTGGENWKAHFSTAFEKLGWSPGGNWTATANGWGARFRRPPDEKNTTELLADVNFSPGERGEWIGLLCLWPVRPQPESASK